MRCIVLSPWNEIKRIMSETDMVALLVWYGLIFVYLIFCTKNRMLKANLVKSTVPLAIIAMTKTNNHCVRYFCPQIKAATSDRRKPGDKNLIVALSAKYFSRLIACHEKVICSHPKLKEVITTNWLTFCLSAVACQSKFPVMYSM